MLAGELEELFLMNAVVTASGIARSLAAAVHDRTLRPGEMFPSERELCERYGVGRNVVRESMTLLQGMGLADLSKGKRPRVAAPTLGKIMVGVSEAAQFFFTGNEGKAHLEQARLFLETSMIRYAIAHATSAQIAKMISAIEACEDNLDDVDAFRNADVSFHRALAEVPGNPIFIALHETFVERLMKNRPVTEDFEVRNKSSNAEHKQIMTALLAKDEAAAVDVLTRHLSRHYGSYFHAALKEHETDS